MIYLSICIPTYNRADYLCKTLDSIITEPEFIETDEVEIVISDNCSTDNTEEEVQKYLAKYPAKIKYNRNTENILDRNYEKVLSLGSGKMLKLNNDTLVLKKDCLGNILNVVKQCLLNGRIPFFLNGAIPSITIPIICNSHMSFVCQASHYVTWIAGFCIPKEKFDKLEDFSRKADLMFVQVDILMRLLEQGNSIEIVPNGFSFTNSPNKKGGYNLAQVFLTNYFDILRPYFKTKKEMEILAQQKRKMLFNFIMPTLIDIYRDSFQKTSKFTFKRSEYRKSVKKEFSLQMYLYFEMSLMLRIGYAITKSKAKELLPNKIIKSLK